MGRQAVTESEARWRVPVAIAAFLAVVLIVGANAVSQTSGDGTADFLRSVEEHKGSVAASGVLQAIGFLLLMAPLLYLFRAARARSERVRPQLIGLVVVAPIFLALSSGLTIGARGEAADQFVAGEAKSTLSAKEAREDCESDREDEGADGFREEFEPAAGESVMAACEKRKVEDEAAENALSEASLAPVVSGLAIAGGLAFAVAFFYASLWGMRTGLLSRFWGSLGMVSGIAFLLGPLFIVALVWLIYFGLLLIGLVPGGRPPAWEAGEAIPWPTPGERAAAELEPTESAAVEGEAGGGKRKRKQRE